ncbi:YetF domain-containing protein, partial [Pseudomonas sp.]
DFSFTNAMLVIATLIVLDVGLSLAKLNARPLARLLDGHATLVVEHGQFLHQRMRRARLTEDDILESARDSQGLESVQQIKFAIVERNGKISIIANE